MIELIYSSLLASLIFEKVPTYDFAGFSIKLPFVLDIIFVGVLLLWVAKNKYKISITISEKIFILFLSLSFLTTLWSFSIKYTLAISALYLLMGLTMFLVKNYLLSNRKLITKTIDFFIWLGVLVSVLGIYQFTAGIFGVSQKFTLLSDLYTKGNFPFPRSQATFFEPSFFANFLFIPIYFILYKYLQIQKEKYLDLRALVVMVAFFLTLSRGANIAFVISIVIFIAILLWTNQNDLLLRLKKPALVCVTGFLIVVTMVLVFAGGRGVKAYFGQVVNSSDAIQLNQKNIEQITRGYTVRVALNHFARQPFGVGTGAFGSIPELISISEKGNPRQTVNSLYPEILVEQGFLGLILFVLFIGSILFKTLSQYLKTKDVLYLVFFSTITAIFIQYFSFSTLYLSYIWVFLGLTLVI